MLPKEKIKVYIKVINGKTVCICKHPPKNCRCDECDTDVVERDRYYGWKKSFKQSKYGK